MKKYLLYITFILSAFTAFAEGEFGIIQDSELKKVGVTAANLEKAKTVITQAETKFKLLVLERKELELKANKLIMEGPSKNLGALEKIFDRIGDIEAEVMKDKVKSQIEMQKYISQEQYKQARELAVQRLNK